MPTRILTQYQCVKMNDFEGKVVLITGAGKGSGRKLAEAFARQGATVAANDISPINAENELLTEI